MNNLLEIWKFQLQVVDLQEVDLPAGAKILTVQMQGALPYLWALMSPTAPKIKRAFYIFGTGHTITQELVAALDYVGTVHFGMFVWHVFELRREPQR
jgi:hypothetical protein